MVNKRSSIASEVPTIAPSNDHTDGTWSATDIYSGEFFLNENDQKLFIRIDGVIKELAFTGGSATTIYTSDDTISSDRVVTLGTSYLYFSVDTPGTGNLGFGRSGQTPSASIHFFAADAGGIFVEGFNSSAGQAALSVFNLSRSLTSARFFNNSDVEIGPENATTVRGRVYIGTTTPEANTKLTIQGYGNTDTTKSIVILDSTASEKFSFRDDGYFTVQTREFLTYFSLGSRFEMGEPTLSIDIKGTKLRFTGSAFLQVNNIVSFSNLNTGVERSNFRNYHKSQASTLSAQTYHEFDIINGTPFPGGTLVTFKSGGVQRVKITEEGSMIVGLGTPNAAALFQVTSTTKGVGLTPMTAAQASAITPFEGLELNVSDTNRDFTSIGKWQYIGGGWIKL